MVHNVLLYSVRRAQRGTVARATPRPAYGHHWSLAERFIENTIAHCAHPPQAFVEHSDLSALVALQKQPLAHGEGEERGSRARGMRKGLAKGRLMATHWRTVIAVLH